VGVEGDKFWLIMPNYGLTDPNRFLSEWVKIWWQWQGDSFKKVAEVKEDSLEKLKSTQLP